MEVGGRFGEGGECLGAHVSPRIEVARSWSLACHEDRIVGVNWLSARNYEGEVAPSAIREGLPHAVAEHETRLKSLRGARDRFPRAARMAEQVDYRDPPTSCPTRSSNAGKAASTAGESRSPWSNEAPLTEIWVVSAHAP